MSTTAANRNYAFWEDGGEMGDLIRQYNWSTTPIGSPDNWPQSLCTTLGIMLHSAFPMFLFWGQELTCFYNDAFRPSLGTEGKHPAIGKHGKEVWAEIWDFIGPLLEQVMNTGKPVYYENQLVPFYRNGRMEDIYWTFSYSPAYGDSGQVCGVVVTCMETTETVLSRMKIEEIVKQRTEELEKANASLTKAYDYLQTIINLLKEPLQVLKPVIENGEIVDFTFKLTNEAYAAYANTTPAELLNKRVGSVFPGYFQTSSFKKVVESFKTGNPNTWEIHYDQDGLDLYNQMSVTKLEDEVVVHFTDFTKLKHLQIELLKKIEELERSNQHLEEFAHAASHDMKEPIRKIQVFTSLLKDQLCGNLKDSELRTVERIEQATKRMALLIDDLLQYSHVSHRPHQKEMVDLNDTIKHVLEDLDLDIHQKKAIVDCDNLPVLLGYKRQLQQMFQNLVSNALKYSKEGVPPHIIITADLVNNDGQYFHLIEVKDNGIGFEQEYHEKIFQMFTRLHGRSEYSGTGIGLSIVKKVIENHQGKIKAESIPGTGTIFKVYLPTA